MHITRMYRGDDGVSHFEDLEVPARDTSVGAISGRFGVEDILFREVQPGLFLDWHHAESRVLIIILSGSIEVTLGTESREFGPGSMVLAEDMDGQGHQTRDLTGPRQSIMIRVPESFDVSEWRIL